MAIPVFEAGAADPPPASMRWLIAALDGFFVQGAEAGWTARVRGVHADACGCCWIQVSRADDESASIVLRCPPDANVHHLRNALRRWGGRSTGGLAVLDPVNTG